MFRHVLTTLQLWGWGGKGVFSSCGWNRMLSPSTELSIKRHSYFDRDLDCAKRPCFGGISPVPTPLPHPLCTCQSHDLTTLVWKFTAFVLVAEHSGNSWNRSLYGIFDILLLLHTEEESRNERYLHLQAICVTRCVLWEVALIVPNFVLQLISQVGVSEKEKKWCFTERKCWER